MSIDLGRIARKLNLPEEKVQRAVELLEEGNTVPFITRYRRDQTGGLDEENIRRIQETASKHRMLAERKQTILKSIQSRGKLTDELSQQIQRAPSIKRLEDLYLPYKAKKQTLASIAREKGLDPLAREVFGNETTALDIDKRATDFISEDKKVASAAEALLGLGHILAEQFSENAELRGSLRKILQRGKLVCSHIEPPSTPQPTEPTTVSTPPPPTSPEDDSSAEVSPETIGPETVEPETSLDESSTPQEADTPEKGTQETSTQEIGALGDEVTSDSKEETDPITDDASSTAKTDDSTAESSAEPDKSQTPEADTPEPVPSEQQTTDKATEPEPEPEPDSQKTPPASKQPPSPPPARVDVAAQKEAQKAAKKMARRLLKEKKRKKLDASFKDYFQYQEPLSKIPPHRTLAIHRGERAKVLRVKIEADHDAMLAEAEKLLIPVEHPHGEFLKGCVRDALFRLLLPSLEREARRELMEKAELHAVSVFARNLRKLLIQPPVRNQRILAIDPGFKSGCKLSALDEFGNLLGCDLLYLVGSEERRKKGRAKLVEMITKHDLNVIAIGNGTACRETEQLASLAIADELKDRNVAFVIVNEAGASVYSTSAIGREELPDHDPTQRSAISIGRRLLDPLSELVKINPANIGVGMYQHDLKVKHLRDTLDAEVESCVNFVGVDVNTASPALLRYVSGLNQLTARRLYEHRIKNGPFKNREQFKEVAGFGNAAFVQSAGFLKISEGENPLDTTWIHPESYEAAQIVLKKLSCSVDDLVRRNETAPPPVETKSEAPQPSEDDSSVSSDHEAQPAEPSGDQSIAAPELSGETTPEAAEPTVEENRQTSLEASPESDASQEESPPANDPPTDAVEAAVTASPAEVSSSQPPQANNDKIRQQIAKVNVAEIAKELNVGQLLLEDILESLTRPGRDPRDDLPQPVFRQGIIKLEDLEGGMQLSGTVLNVVDFGVFVDIGLSDSGLVHISRLADRYIRDPHEVVSIGDVLKIWVLEVDKKRRRVSLTAIEPGKETARKPHGEKTDSRGKPGGRKKGGQRPKSKDRGSKPRQGGQGKRHSVRPANHRPKPKPKPVTPITDKMVDGKEPMRTFSDLLQFMDKKEDDPPKSPDTKK